jgi:hypothetical protein
MLEALLGLQQVVFVEELPDFIAHDVELPGITLSAFVVRQRRLFDDAGVDQFLDVLVDGGGTDARVQLLGFGVCGDEGVLNGRTNGVLRVIIEFDERRPHRWLIDNAAFG